MFHFARIGSCIIHNKINSQEMQFKLIDNCSYGVNIKADFILRQNQKRCPLNGFDAIIISSTSFLAKCSLIHCLEMLPIK